MISLEQAQAHVTALEPLNPVAVPVEQAAGLVCSEDVYARVDCPTIDSSLKDGFAIISSDIEQASPQSPVLLKVSGALAAGEQPGILGVVSGTAVRIMTGAPVPPGATAVVSDEFTRLDGCRVMVFADSATGRNILRKGSDIALEQLVLVKGTFLNPAHIGLLAAAGVETIGCYPAPKVVVAATGSELVMVGEPIAPGRVIASNMYTAAAELQALGVAASTVLLRDNLDSLRERFQELIKTAEVLITCGGVLDGDKDLTLKALEQLGMEQLFHRVRIGPGKGACMGKIGSTVVFNLPGGPPSNHVALHLLALPGVRRLMGAAIGLAPKRCVVAAEALHGQRGWTQLVHARLEYAGGIITAYPLRGRRRLEALAGGTGLIEIPEGCEAVEQGATVKAWCIREHPGNSFAA